MTEVNVSLDRLRGTWKNKVPGPIRGAVPDVSGWNFFSHPTEGDASDNGFRVDSKKLSETVDIERRFDLVRSIGIKGNADYWRAYNYVVKTLDWFFGYADRFPIETHHETGYFLLRVESDGKAPDPGRGDIVREGSVPRANTFLTTGVAGPGTVAGVIDAYSAQPRVLEAKVMDAVKGAYNKQRQDILDRGGPDFDRPLDWLKDQVGGQPVKGEEEDWVLEFRGNPGPSNMAQHQVQAERVGIGELSSHYWIGTREINDVKFDFLQYAQVVDLTFGGAVWPHVTVNTLINQRAN